MRSLRSAFVAVSLGLIGCLGHTASSAFTRDFGCNDGVETKEIAYQRYRVTGCGLTANYDCVGGSSCELDAPADSGSKPRTAASSVAQSPREEPSKLAASDGAAPLVLELQLTAAVLTLSTIPTDASSGVRLKLVYATDPSEDQACQLEWMLNGEHLEGPNAKFVRNTRTSVHTLSLPAQFVDSLATARKMGLKSCKRHWSLQPEQLAEIRGFIERIADEAAWDRKPRSGAPARLVAPSSGWPAWVATGAVPAPAKRQQALDGPALYKVLAPSIFQVEALAAARASQGSAVAVTAHEVLTNCHVVEGAKKIILKREKKEWVAALSRSSPDTDRCVLSVPEAELSPIAGVRSFESLEVGETVYTLGAPSGFDLSLASGVVSGRREENGLKFVQTTAPISPGSSGGGLFDVRGNLIGITTLIVVGRERVNQALNFAISADSFWQP